MMMGLQPGRSCRAKRFTQPFRLCSIRCTKPLFLGLLSFIPPASLGAGATELFAIAGLDCMLEVSMIWPLLTHVHASDFVDASGGTENTRKQATQEASTVLSGPHITRELVRLRRKQLGFPQVPLGPPVSKCTWHAQQV